MSQNRCLGFTELTGGGEDALDLYDGDYLSNHDMAIVNDGDNVYFYTLNAGSGAAEASPYVIAPDTNAGTKRWVLLGISGQITQRVFIPIADAIDGTAAPDDLATVTSGNGKVNARTFDNASSEDVRIPWVVPWDICAPAGIKFRVICVVTEATGPSAEGVVFSLSGYSSGHGDGMGGTFGTEGISEKALMTESQYDVILTDLSSTVTVTNLAAGELSMLKVYRDHDHADDTYGQVIGVIGVEIEYTRVIRQ